MAPFVTQGFHHITMVSRSAQRSLNFYRDILGLGLAVNLDGPGSYHLYFGDAGGSPGPRAQGDRGSTDVA